MNSNQQYTGEDFEEWVAFFKLSENCQSCLAKIGAKTLTDIQEIFLDLDKELLKGLEEELSPIEYRKFLRARQNASFLVQPVPLIGSLSATSSLGNPSTRADCIDDSLSCELDSIPVAIAVITSDITATGSKSAERIQELEDQLRCSQELAKNLEENIKKEKIKAKEYKRRKQIMGINVDVVASVDVAFVFDLTNSMKSHLQVSKDCCDEIVTHLHNEYPTVPLRVSFIGYTDFCNGDTRYSVMGFTTDLKEFKTFLQNQTTRSGDDAAEDVFGALNIAANSLTWESSTRILFHITDAPCHGTEFHGPKTDDKYPLGDKYGLQALDLLQKLKTLKILYKFGKIENATDRMIERFNELMDEPYVETLKLRLGNMMEIISMTISNEVTSSLSMTSHTSSNGSKDTLQLIPLQLSKPVWNTIPSLTALKYRVILPTIPFEEFCQNVGTQFVADIPEPEFITIKCASHPFAKGSSRAAYHGEVQTLPMPTNVVLKALMYKKLSKRDKKHYSINLECHVIAMTFANRFNELLPKDAPKIEFKEPCLLQFFTKPDDPYMVMEHYLKGKFEKFNGNNGIMAKNPSPNNTNHDVVQAFSHWTYEISQKTLMIVDNQGVYDSYRKTFYLTDPAIHSVEVLRFGGTNYGENGFEEYFKTHQCNGICQALHLNYCFIK